MSRFRLGLQVFEFSPHLYNSSYQDFVFCIYLHIEWPIEEFTGLEVTLFVAIEIRKCTSNQF